MKPQVKNNRMSDIAPRLLQKLEELKGKEVLVVGDVGLDEYVLGQVRRISPEAPVPVVEVESEENRLGLAANVAQNIASLGGVPRLLGVVGKDQAAESLRFFLKASGVSPEHLIVDSTRPTTRKLRVMVQNHHIVRVDYEKRQFISAEVEKSIISQTQKLLPQISAVVIQDYAKGVVSENLVQALVKICREAKKKILVDPHRTTPLATYLGVDLMTPNYDEAIALTGIPEDDLRKNSDLLIQRGQKLMEVIGAQKMVITRGKDGLRIFENGEIVDFPTNAKQVFDVTGAGDTVIAALALAWGAGFTLQESCVFANYSAGIVVGKIGCVPCPLDELIQVLRRAN